MNDSQSDNHYQEKPAGPDQDNVQQPQSFKNKQALQEDESFDRIMMIRNLNKNGSNSMHRVSDLSSTSREHRVGRIEPTIESEEDQQQEEIRIVQHPKPRSSGKGVHS